MHTESKNIFRWKGPIKPKSCSLLLAGLLRTKPLNRVTKRELLELWQAWGCWEPVRSLSVKKLFLMSDLNFLGCSCTFHFLVKAVNQLSSKANLRWGVAWRVWDQPRKLNQTLPCVVNNMQIVRRYGRNMVLHHIETEEDLGDTFPHKWTLIVASLYGIILVLTFGSRGFQQGIRSCRWDGWAG